MVSGAKKLILSGFFCSLCRHLGAGICSLRNTAEYPRSNGSWRLYHFVDFCGNVDVDHKVSWLGACNKQRIRPRRGLKMAPRRDVLTRLRFSPWDPACGSGKEGPLVHVACCCANLFIKLFPALTTMRVCSSLLEMRFPPHALADNSCQREREGSVRRSRLRHFCCLCSPIGGVLFSLEQLHTLFPIRPCGRASSAP